MIEELLRMPRPPYPGTLPPLPSCGLKAVSLFSGAGGMSLGFERAGFGHAALVEFDKHAAGTLKCNRPEWNVINGDVRKIDWSGYASCGADVVEGGWPCQAFSHAGKRLGFDDIRGTLFFEFARCVKDLNPKAIVGENVVGLTTHDGGKTLQTVMNVLDDLGYDAKSSILKAVNYDVPQRRDRTIIIGIRKDLSVAPSFPTPGMCHYTLKEALNACPDGVGQAYSDKKTAVLKLVPPGGNWKSLPPDIRKAYMNGMENSGGGCTGVARRLAWDEPCLTLLCSASQKYTERCHPDEVRPLTVRESARIQTFPDDWTFTGPVAAQYKQVGNAVPVNLARHIAVHVAKLLDTKRQLQ